MIETETLDFMDQMIKIQERIAEALEKIVKFMTPFPVVVYPKEGEQHKNEMTDTNSKPFLKEVAQPLERKIIKISPGFDIPKTKMVQTQNFVDVRECVTYSEKSYRLIGYDNKVCYIAKQHVIRTESIEGGGTRVIVSEKSAWVISKLEWK